VYEADRWTFHANNVLEVYSKVKFVDHQDIIDVACNINTKTWTNEGTDTHNYTVSQGKLIRSGVPYTYELIDADRFRLLTSTGYWEFERE
jgi:hypothetical protein